MSVTLKITVNHDITERFRCSAALGSSNNAGPVKQDAFARDFYCGEAESQSQSNFPSSGSK